MIALNIAKMNLDKSRLKLQIWYEYEDKKSVNHREYKRLQKLIEC